MHSTVPEIFFKPLDSGILGHPSCDVMGVVSARRMIPWGRGLRQGAWPAGALRPRRKCTRRRGDVRRRGPAVTAGPGGHGAPVPAAGAGRRPSPGAARGPAAAAALREEPARGGQALPGTGERRARGSGRAVAAPGRGKAPRRSEPSASLPPAACPGPSSPRPENSPGPLGTGPSGNEGWRVGERRAAVPCPPGWKGQPAPCGRTAGSCGCRTVGLEGRRGGTPELLLVLHPAGIHGNLDC